MRHAWLLLAVPITRQFGVAYGAFILVMILPPLFRGGFLSLGRLTSTLFPLFLYLGWQLRGTPLAVVAMAFADHTVFDLSAEPGRGEITDVGKTWSGTLDTSMLKASFAAEDCGTVGEPTGTDTGWGDTGDWDARRR